MSKPEENEPELTLEEEVDRMMEIYNSTDLETPDDPHVIHPGPLPRLPDTPENRKKLVEILRQMRDPSTPSGAFMQFLEGKEPTSSD